MYSATVVVKQFCHGGEMWMLFNMHLLIIIKIIYGMTINHRLATSDYVND